MVFIDRENPKWERPYLDRLIPAKISTCYLCKMGVPFVTHAEDQSPIMSETTTSVKGPGPA
jgi:hypothetical protein